jgi:D-alanyl-D-alanine carboxypeptidase
MARGALLGLLLEAVVVSACVAAYAAGEARPGIPGDPRTTAGPIAAISTSVASPSPAATATATPSPTSSATPSSTPAPSPTPVDPFAVTNFAPLPGCDLGQAPAFLVATDQWPLTLVDKTYSVSREYVPADLVDVRKAGFGGSYKIRAVMVDDLAAMRADASRAGGALAIFSSYRSYQEQIWSFGHWSNVLGPSALMSSARPGHSEHQLGLAIDFREYGGPVSWAYRDFARETTAGAWLAKNAWKYGFIMSYPWSKTAQVCYGYEPWHYRYVGRAEAAAIHASGQTLRVWLWQHQPDQLWKSGASASTLPAPTP